jgi:phage gpG-like protein
MVVRIRPKRGGDKALADFKRAIETSPQVLDSISRNLAEETVGLIKDGFRREADPYGGRWKPKKIADGRKVLSGKTSRLKGGWHVASADRRGFVVAPAVDYATYHQSGTRKMAARPMLPDGRGIPDSWQDAWEGIISDVLSHHFRKVGSGKRRINVKALVRKVMRAVG